MYCQVAVDSIVSNARLIAFAGPRSPRGGARRNLGRGNVIFAAIVAPSSMSTRDLAWNADSVAAILYRCFRCVLPCSRSNSMSKTTRTAYNNVLVGVEAECKRKAKSYQGRRKLWRKTDVANKHKIQMSSCSTFTHFSISRRSAANGKIPVLYASRLNVNVSQWRYNKNWRSDFYSFPVLERWSTRVGELVPLFTAPFAWVCV